MGGKLKGSGVFSHFELRTLQSSTHHDCRAGIQQRIVEPADYEKCVYYRGNL